MNDKIKRGKVTKELGNEIYNRHIMINLAINGEELQRLQFCCEFVEQFIGSSEAGHMSLCKEFGLTHDDVYWFGDEWSFKLRHIMEDEYRKRMELK